ncbi:uncharacterized protein LOC134691676 [Mytilus trossulus]|uniref:uncharacterized protein LOC134691676 n=1 Tax=Mytilus trossulus TaxID=6551 RepID=UPI0030040E89
MMTYNSTALDDLDFCNSTICGLEAFIIGVIGIVCFILSFVMCCVAHYKRYRRNASFVVREEKYVNTIENGKENSSLNYGYDVTYTYKEPQYEEIGRYDKDPTQREKGLQSSPYANAESCHISIHSGGQTKQQTVSKKSLEYDYVDVNDIEGKLQRQIVRNSNERCYINKQFADDNGTNDTSKGMSNKRYANSNVSCDKSTSNIYEDDRQNGKGNKARDQFITEMNKKLAQKKNPRNGVQTKNNRNDNGCNYSETDAEYEDASSAIRNMSSPNNNPVPKPKTYNSRDNRCHPGKFHQATLQNVQSVSMFSLSTCHHPDSNDKRASAAYDSDSTESLNGQQSSDSSLSDDPFMKMKQIIHQDSGSITVTYNKIRNVIVNKT